MTKKILVIDDERTLKLENAVYARTSKIGQDLLYGFSWDEVWLDHDLSGNDTIRGLVLKIEEEAYKGKILNIERFVVHTMNPVGRWWIFEALKPWYKVDVITNIWVYEE